MNKNGICLVLNGECDLFRMAQETWFYYFSDDLTSMWSIEVPPASFLGSQVDSILNFTVNKQHQGTEVSQSAMSRQ